MSVGTIDRCRRIKVLPKRGGHKIVNLRRNGRSYETNFMNVRPGKSAVDNSIREGVLGGASAVVLVESLMNVRGSIPSTSSVASFFITTRRTALQNGWPSFVVANHFCIVFRIVIR